MSETNEELKKLVAAAQGKILPASSENLAKWLSHDFLPEWALESIAELFKKGDFDEIDDRFFKPLAFGTGGCADAQSAKSRLRRNSERCPTRARPNTRRSAQAI